MEVFGLNYKTVAEALKKGIYLIKDGKKLSPPGVLTLAYHPQLNRFIFVFGTTKENAGFVLLEDFNKMWEIKDYEEKR